MRDIPCSNGFFLKEKVVQCVKLSFLQDVPEQKLFEKKKKITRRARGVQWKEENKSVFVENVACPNSSIHFFNDTKMILKREEKNR